MKKIILILFVFSIAPTFLWAQSNIQIIKGMNDLLKVTRSEDFKKWTDTGGRVHIQNLETKGLMSYSIDGKEYMHELKQKFALLIQDSNKNTEIYGQFRITPEGNEKILWIGHFKVEGTNGFTYGFYWGKGENENEGKIIEWSFAEDPRNLSKNNKNPNIYLMSGIITDQPKDNL